MLGSRCRSLREKRRVPTPPRPPPRRTSRASPHQSRPPPRRTSTEINIAWPQYRITNEFLRAETDGLIARHTPLMSDMSQGGLRWGSTVHGVEHYGWVRLTRPESFKGLWLPIRVEGVEVLRREIRSASSAASVAHVT